MNFDFLVGKFAANGNRLAKKTENFHTKKVQKKFRQIEEAIAN